MRQIFTYTYSWILIFAVAICMNCAYVFAAKLPQHDTTNYFFTKKKAKKSLLSFSLPPIHPGVISSARVSVARNDDKLLSNVEVYPNPITDQLNLRYAISRNSNVTIKMVDVLGNDIMSFSERVDPGEHTKSYPITNKLNRGFYFIRVIAGTESIIKRISVL